jgi:hypothetical protein
MRLAALLLLSFAVGGPASVEQSAKSDSCAASPMIHDSAPLDPNADPVGPANWYINADRTIWAGPVPEDGWPSGGTLFSRNAVVKGQKTYWVRPRGTQLVISGRRLDAGAAPVEAHIPCCYPSGFQIVGLFFPTEGCWKITAKSGDSELKFITQVRRTSGEAGPGTLPPEVAARLVNGVIHGAYPDVRSMLIYHKRALRLEEYFYGYDRDRPRQMRSLTKSVISLLAGAAVDRGLLRADGARAWAARLRGLRESRSPQGASDAG